MKRKGSYIGGHTVISARSEFAAQQAYLRDLPPQRRAKTKKQRARNSDQAQILLRTIESLVDSKRIGKNEAYKLLSRVERFIPGYERKITELRKKIGKI